MSAPLRLGLYGAILVVVFAVAAVTAGAVVPEETVQRWTDEAEASDHHPGDGQAGEEADDRVPEAAPDPGLSDAVGGYRLTSVTAPAETGVDGELSFVVLGPDGEPLTGHADGLRLDLVVVRTDGTHLRLERPDHGDDGTWSVPWQWHVAGTYRVYVDLTPNGAGEAITLSTTVSVEEGGGHGHGG